MINILCPEAGQNAQVVTQEGGAEGKICVKASLATTFRNELSAPEGDGVFVRVKVWNGTITEAPPFPNGEGSVDLTLNGDYYQSPPYVPVPYSTASSPYPALTLVAWEVAGSPPYNAVLRHIYGARADSYNCCDGFDRRQILRPAVTLAPVVWNLTLTDFPSPLGKRLNGDSVLTLQDAPGLTAIWRNEGDGVNEPRIELSWGGPRSNEWKLRIQYGPSTLEYTAPVAWHAVGPLTLTAVNGMDVPATLTLSPGA
jgi:hypothetical protein